MSKRFCWLSLAVVFLLCLNVCAVPASAADVYSYDVLGDSPSLLVFNSSSNVLVTSFFTELYGQYNVDYENNLHYILLKTPYFSIDYGSSKYFYPRFEGVNNTFIELIFNYPNSNVDLSVYPVSFSCFAANSQDYLTDHNVEYDMFSDGKTLATLLVDNVSQGEIVSSGSDSVLSYSGTAVNDFRIRFNVGGAGSPNVTRAYYTDKDYKYLAGDLRLNFPVLLVNDIAPEPDKIDIVIGKLDALGNSIESIRVNMGDLVNTTKAIENAINIMNQSLSNMSNTLTDMSSQLQNKDSNIWTAAKDTIGGALKDAFVPSQEDMEQLNQQAQDLAKDKLGGAYTAMEEVDNAVGQLKDKLNNVTPSEGIEFPGIGLPGGLIEGQGEIILAEKQMVTLPPKLTAILHPVAGTIVSIVVGLATFRVLADMVECFFSGYSYSAFLHRDKGGGDDD